jgi:hypothetical protein
MPYIKVGAKVIFKKADLDRFMERRRVETTG